MSLENPHKIAKKDGHLQEIAKKNARLPYLVIFCQHMVLKVSLGECWVKVPTKNIVSSQCTHKIHFIAFLQSRNEIA
jgi:hypothetical protein